MKIKITEDRLRDIVQESINNFLDKKIVYDNWNNFSKKYISEGLTITYSIGKVLGILKRKYNFNELNIVESVLDNYRNSSNILAPFTSNSKTTRDNDNWYSFSLCFETGIQDNQEIVKDIIHTCDACGWYLSDGVYFLRDKTEQKIDVKNKNTLNLIEEKYKNIPLRLTFRAKFNVEYKEDSLPPYLYHICPLRVLDKIMRQGLTPRNNNRIAFHPERVYLFIDYPKEWKNNIVKNFKISGRDEKYVLLRISTEKLKGIKFYYDSNFMTNYPAVYTLEPITPSAITLLEIEKQ